jgi:hypothetical protein
MPKTSIDKLFDEKNKTTEIPPDVVEAIKEIMLRNDEFSSSNNRRVSMIRTVEWIQEEFGYKIGPTQVQELARQLGRRSWARA